VRTNDQEIFLEWEPIISTDDIGGSAIISYGLQRDDRTDGSSWYDLTGYAVDSTLLTFSTQTVTAGAEYRLRL